MTVQPDVSRVRGLCHQLLMVILINIPTISLGMAMGWVSLVSGERGAADGARVVAAAATTFLASLVGVPLSARALCLGRKFAIVVTSVCFVVCWSLKLIGGGWWLVAARIAAGLGGAGAYSVSPLVAREMCEGRVRGAASSALILAHNVGFLLMYLAADFAVPHRTVLWACLGISLVHCVLFLLVPESPAYLAANNRQKEAVASLAWLRGVDVDHPSLAEELAALPLPEETHTSSFALLKDMLSHPSRRRAFIISFVAIVGQEACGVYTLMQFAERTFVMARDDSTPTEDLPIASALVAYNIEDILRANSTEVFGANRTSYDVFPSMANGTGTVIGDVLNATVVQANVAGALLSPARQAVVLGAVQLVASAIALYLVERVGRRRLLITSAIATAACLALGAAAAHWGRGAWAGAALAGAVAADNAGLQPAPYALLADMFHYQYRSAALMLASAAACIGNAVEVVVFPVLAARCGLAAALLLAALLTAAYAAFACTVPETRGKTPEEIYAVLGGKGNTVDGGEKGDVNGGKGAGGGVEDAERGAVKTSENGDVNEDTIRRGDGNEEGRRKDGEKGDVKAKGNGDVNEDTIRRGDGNEEGRRQDGQNTLLNDDGNEAGRKNGEKGAVRVRGNYVNEDTICRGDGNEEGRRKDGEQGAVKVRGNGDVNVAGWKDVMIRGKDESEKAGEKFDVKAVDKGVSDNTRV